MALLITKRIDLADIQGVLPVKHGPQNRPVLRPKAEKSEQSKSYEQRDEKRSDPKPAGRVRWRRRESLADLAEHYGAGQHGEANDKLISHEQRGGEQHTQGAPAPHGAAASDSRSAARTRITANKCTS